MAGLGIGPFQHLATAQALEKQPDVADGLSSRAVLDASRSLSTASTDTAGMELLTASRGQSLCGPDDITEEEELLSRELTREILLEGYGVLGCDPPHPSSSRRSSRGASRHTSTEPLCDQFSGLMACREAKEEPDPPLYEQVGGGVVMKRIVDDFYRRVLGDARLARFFGSVDMATHRRKFLLFATYVMGGPDEYEHAPDPWPQLYTVHERLVKHSGLKEVHLDAIKGHFQASLEQYGVGPKQVARAMEIVESTRRVIFPLQPPSGPQGQGRQQQQQQQQPPGGCATQQPEA